MQSAVTRIAILALFLSQASCSSPESKRLRTDPNEASSSHGQLRGLREIQAISRYLRELPQVEIARPGVLEQNIARMLESIDDIGPELMEELDPQQVECPFCGCDFNLLKEMALSLRGATQNCEKETLDFLQSIISELTETDDFLHLIALNLMDSCLTRIASDVAGRLARSLGKGKLSVFSLVDRMARKRVMQSKDVSKEAMRALEGESLNYAALRTLGLHASRGEAIVDLLIEIANEKGEARYSNKDLVTRVRDLFREQLLYPCEDIALTVDQVTSNFKEYEGAMEILDEALELEREDNPDISSEVEIVRICLEVRYYRDSILKAIETRFKDTPSTSKQN